MAGSHTCAGPDATGKLVDSCVSQPMVHILKCARGVTRRGSNKRDPQDSQPCQHSQRDNRGSPHITQPCPQPEQTAHTVSQPHTCITLRQVQVEGTVCAVPTADRQTVLCVGGGCWGHVPSKAGFRV
eukprot:101959-Chlamydomonas_euryale.AAC.2